MDLILYMNRILKLLNFFLIGFKQMSFPLDIFFIVQVKNKYLFDKDNLFL